MFNRIWDTPDNGYAEKFKHTIEPFVNLTRTSSIDNFARIVKLDGTDSDRRRHDHLHLRRQQSLLREAAIGRGRTARAGARDLHVDLRQTYYSNKEAQTVDPQYSTSNSAIIATEQLSPIA